MDKICRSVTTLYKLPRISHLNLRLGATITAPNHGYVGPFNYWNQISVRNFSSIKPVNTKVSGARMFSRSSEQTGEQPMSITEVLDREIQDESAELSKQLSSDQFPGFSVETDGADVALTKQVGDKTVSVRFTVSSSLAEWPAEEPPQKQGQETEPMLNTTLISMPEFQVQITRGSHTLELSCFFEEMEEDPETGEAYATEPTFSIDEMVMYEGEPNENEYAVSARYFDQDLTDALERYLAENGIDHEFAKNLVTFSTNYEKRRYVSFMKQLRNFV